MRGQLSPMTVIEKELDRHCELCPVRFQPSLNRVLAESPESQKPYNYP